MLKREFRFFFVTLQVETACLDESGAEAIDVTRHEHIPPASRLRPFPASTGSIQRIWRRATAPRICRCASHRTSGGTTSH